MQLTKDRVRIEWVDIGEGICGDYNVDDPDDIFLLRFYVSFLEDNDWIDCEDASYCTFVPADTTDDKQMALLECLMSFFYKPVMNGESIKKLGERMSWINPSWVL